MPLTASVHGKRSAMPQCRLPQSVHMVNSIIPNEPIQVRPTALPYRISRWPATGERVIVPVLVVRHMDGFGIDRLPPQPVGSHGVKWISRPGRSGAGRCRERAETGVRGVMTGVLAASGTPGGHRKGAGARGWEDGGHHWIGGSKIVAESKITAVEDRGERMVQSRRDSVWRDELWRRWPFLQSWSPP